MTLDEFISSLSEMERVFIDSCERKLKAYILLNGEVVETDMMVAVLWQIRFPDTIRIGKDIIGNKTISTVFLTVTSSYHFETMCFTKRDGRVINRYKTLKEAQKGHKEACEEK